MTTKSEKPKWISFKEKRPEINEPIYFLNGKRVIVGAVKKWRKNSADFEMFYDDKIVGAITHWMPVPLPEPL